MEFITNEFLDINNIKKILVDIKFDEVTKNLQQVAAGKLPLPDCLSVEEISDIRDIFGWFCEVRPQEILKMLESVFSAEQNQTFDGPNWDGYKVIAAIERLIHADLKTKQRFVVLLMSYIFYEEFHYPQPETGVYDIAGNKFDQLKWVYRYWFNQLEVPEKGSELKSFFASQDVNIMVKEPTSIVIPPIPQEMWKRSLSLSCGGDLLAVDVLTPKNTTHLFDDITDFYSSADIVSANLESTIDDDKPFGRMEVKGKPFIMNTHTSMFHKFRNDAKINFFSTATNHAMDLGEDGVLKTLSVLKQSGAYYSGTAASEAEQEDVVVIEKNGLRVALLAFTFDLNGYKVPDNAPYMVNEVRFNDICPDYSLIEKQVAIAKAKGAEHIVAYCHWGWEFEMYPHVNIVKAAHKVIECGVDTILGNHPHVSQPAQIIERPNMPPALVIYAFGDFVSYHPNSRNSKLAYLVKFDIVSYFGAKAAVTNVRALPIYIVNAHLDADNYDCRIVKFENVLKNPDGYGLTELEKNQLPHLRDKVWNEILSPLVAVTKNC